MSGFSVRVLTTHGQALIAGATAGNRLEFKRMRVSQSAMTEQQAAASVPTDFSVDFGSIKSASASGSVCRVVATYKNPLSSELHLKTFALCGQLENSATEDVVAVQSGADVDVALAPYGTPGDTVLIGFSLNVAAGSAVLVEVTGSESATLDDLERFVSCHKAGDTMSGEDQDIYGKKSFKSPINPVFGLDWPTIDVGSSITVKSQQTSLTGGATQVVHHVFRMTNDTAGVTHGLKCVYDEADETMTLSSDVDRVELPTLALAPERTGNGLQLSPGQILLLHVTRSGVLMPIWTGEVFTGSDGWSIWTALFKPNSGTFDEGFTEVSTHKFRAMSDVQGLANGEKGTLLAQCIE